MDSLFYGNRQPGVPKPTTAERMSMQNSGAYHRNSFEAPRQSHLFVPPAVQPRPPSNFDPRPPSYVAPAQPASHQPMR